eukprot:NODE_2923_length_1088_cov_29.922040_g2682_i0.p1 GENE.NODE_2923_length_1088_cov_29.922040_g2682_i0~~NODE_2923_length_1088_cov_29.922040_g2682_i0.p1  ORF type:complete len:344 (-),score=71.26 NODE_2923_length_1088_cov_29.922040_g2682_i0:56-964(-)
MDALQRRVLHMLCVRSLATEVARALMAVVPPVQLEEINLERVLDVLAIVLQSTPTDAKHFHLLLGVIALQQKLSDRGLTCKLTVNGSFLSAFVDRYLMSCLARGFPLESRRAEIIEHLQAGLSRSGLIQVSEAWSRAAGYTDTHALWDEIKNYHRTRRHTEGAVLFPKISHITHRFRKLPADQRGAILRDQSRLAQFLEQHHAILKLGPTPITREESGPTHSITGSSTLLDKEWRREQQLKKRKIKGSRNSRRGVPRHRHEKIEDANYNRPLQYCTPAIAKRFEVRLQAREECRGAADFAVN